MSGEERNQYLEARWKIHEGNRGCTDDETMNRGCLYIFPVSYYRAIIV
jgi:hypothetical protein